VVSVAGEDISSNYHGQRADPWLIFLPVLWLGLGSTSMFGWMIYRIAVSTTYLQSSSLFLDQIVFLALGSLLSRFAVICTGSVAIVTGAGIYRKLTRNAYSDDESEMRISRRTILVFLAWFIIPVAALQILGYPYSTGFALSEFLGDLFYAVFGGIGLVIGLGFIFDYLEFTKNTTSSGAKVELILVWSSTSPSVVERTTGVTGGYFYWLFDNRVKGALLRRIPLAEGRALSSYKSPDEVRRDQHLTW
jgi:hypothetical protein